MVKFAPNLENFTMLKNILNNRKINKIRKSHSGFNHLIQRIDSLTKSKSSHQEMFEKINMYLDLIERDQQIDIAKEHKHIEATHAQNQKNKEIEHKKKQKQQSKNKVAQFFYDNLAEYKLACTSPTELFNIFQKNKFKSGIYEQTSKMNWYENKLINMLETSGNDFIINFTITKDKNLNGSLDFLVNIYTLMLLIQIFFQNCIQ